MTATVQLLLFAQFGAIIFFFEPSFSLIFVSLIAYRENTRNKAFIDMSSSYRNHSIDCVKDVSTSSNAVSMTHKHLDYKSKNGGSLAAHFIFECAIKLNMKPLTSATASVIYHRFFREVESDAYDEFVCFIYMSAYSHRAVINQN